MEPVNEPLLNQLKHLLAISNDGKEGYRNAAENVDASELKALLTAYSIQRSEFSSELKTQIRLLGGNPDNDEGGPLGLLHRAWIDIKTVFTINDNKAVLEACETGEKAAIEAYDKALEHPEIASAARQLLSHHRKSIADSLQNIQRLEIQYA